MHTSIGPEHYLSVLSANNGLLIFQGFRKPALFVSRDEVPRFIRDPERSTFRIIPPMAALSLNCYLALNSFDRIELKQPFASSEDYSLTMLSARAPAVRYYSDHDDVESIYALRAENVGVVVTPKATYVLDGDHPVPALTTVVELPEPEVPDYCNPFAQETRLLREAVLRIINHHQLGFHHEP